ncbi:hypothetical protein ACIQI8_33100 [Streptomyces sp. NPDC092369]|uniref:hypothetical protein n=1 Tax=Streptomyces sp. NPDC092369 TaxID=3366015 RepID=UPI003822FE19
MRQRRTRKGKTVPATPTRTPATAPRAKAPVLRLAGDSEDAWLEPHICRSID